jgi:hypothetical protein
MTPEQKKQLFDEKNAQDRRRLALLITLGKEKKLWTIQFSYRCELNSIGTHTMRNQTGDEIMKARETMFTHGFLLPVDMGHWRIIQPKDILTVDLWRQSDYFDEI